MVINEVCVVGGGLMGSGIAQVCAQSRLVVHLCDLAEEPLARAIKTIA